MYQKVRINPDKTCTYYITVYGNRDISGKRPRKRMTYTTVETTPAKQEKEVQAVEMEFAKNFKGISGIDTREFTFAAYYDLWKANSVKYNDLTIAVREEMCGIIERRLIPFLGTTKVVDISPDIVSQIVEKEMKEGLSPKSIRKTIGGLNYVLKYASSKGVIDKTKLPTIGIELPKLEKKKALFFDVPQAKRFLNILSDYGPMWETFFYLSILSGARRGEICALKWSDIDYENAEMSISKAARITKAYGPIVKEPKTEKSVRVVDLPPICLDVLRKWQKEQKKLAENWNGYDNFIFTQSDGRMLYPSSPTAKFKKILKKYNESASDEEKLPSLHLHQLRHSCATILVSKDLDIETISNVLGHSPEILLSVYAHATDQEKRRAADIMQKTFAG